MSVVVVVIVLVVSATAGSGPAPVSRTQGAAKSSGRHPRRGGALASVPILAYNVINAPPPGSTANPSLYVPAGEFSAQMNALKAAGWHAVTLNQLYAFWRRGVPLGAGKPIVLTFDTGYASQYANALPILKQLGWVGVENLQVNGLSQSDGGITDAQIRALVSAGWELDTDGVSGTDLTTIDGAQLNIEVTGARQILSTRYGAPVNWFRYPQGHYDPTVIAAVRAAGFDGAMTDISGWASPARDGFLLPRVAVTGGTSPTALLSQIAAAQSSPPPPTNSGSGT